MSSYRRKFVLLIGFLLGVLFLSVAVRETNVREIWSALKGANFWLAGPFLVTLALLFWIRAVRWSVLLEPLREGVRGRDVFPAVMIGFASNIVLPPPLSEFVRMWIIGRQLGLKNTSVLTTILLERVFDFLAVVLLLGIALLTAPMASEEVAFIAYLGGLAALIVITTAVAYVGWTERFMAALTRTFKVLPVSIDAALTRHAALVAAGLTSLKSRRCIVSVTILTLVQWVLMGIGIFTAMLAVHLSAHPSAALVVLAITFLGVTLPTSPGAVGTIQLSFALALAPYGVSGGDAVAASIFWHVIAYCFVISIGCYYFVKLGYTLGEIRGQAHSGGFPRIG